MDNLKDNLEILWNKAEDQYEAGMLCVHVSYCHDTEKEIENADRVGTWFYAYTLALSDIGKIYGINLDHMKKE